jgi:hypothetical protein
MQQSFTVIYYFKKRERKRKTATKRENNPFKAGAFMLVRKHYG